jgi:cytochrome c553
MASFFSTLKTERVHRNVYRTRSQAREDEGNGTFPRLAGQHSNYLIQQVDVFQQTAQRPRGGPMNVVTHGLTEAETLD